MGQFNRILTHHGSLVTEDPATGEVDTTLDKHTSEHNPPLLAYVPNQRPDTCFLISSRSTVLRLLPTQTGRTIAVLGMTRAGDGTVGLFDTDSGLWLCAVPLDGHAIRRGRLVAAFRHIDAYERFTLLPVAPAFVDSSAAAVAAQLEALLARPLDIALVRQTEPGSADALQAVARLAPRAALQGLAEALLASPAECRHFARLFPDDPYGEHGLQALADWRAARVPPPQVPKPRGLFARLSGRPHLIQPSPEPAATRVIGPEYDRLAPAGLLGEYGSLPYACNAHARRTIVPKQGLCIVATARNEGLYLLEWLAYHRAIGVEAVFLYTNNNDDGSDALAEALAAAGMLHWIRSDLGPGGNAQMKAYGHALALNPAVLDHRWALVIDLDEYLMVKPALFRSAADYLQWQEAGACDAIALNWVILGSAGQARWRDEFIGRRFPSPAEPVNRHIKTLFRPQRFIHARPHYPQTYRGEAFTFRAANADHHIPFEGQWSFSAQPNADFAWINHYFYKSAQEFAWKWSRNRGDHALLEQPSAAVLPAGFVHAFVGQFALPSVATPGPDHCAPGLDDELARLKALPGVAEAWARVKQIYDARIRTIVTLFATAPGVVEAGEDGKAFLAILDQ